MQLEIRRATIDDALLLFNWSNDPITRANSFHSEEIEWENHLSWFTRKLSDNDSQIFLFEIKQQPVGVVRFETNGTTTIGVNVDASFRGRGMGAVMINVACDEFWQHSSNDIIAYIKPENIGSQRSFEKAGFQFLSREILGGFDRLIYRKRKLV